MTELIIDLASDADPEWCANLMAASEPWLTLGRDREACLACCRAPQFEMLMVRRDGERCGFLLLHPTGVAGSPYIASIVIHPTARGQGIGSKLLEAAEVRQPDARHIFLCVSSFNLRAQRLYERRGYSKAGEFPDYVVAGTSEILMHKRLVWP
ncbi:MAG: GNAT family N-acetyltransferase [Bryobacteraceae bacterium]